MDSQAPDSVVDPEGPKPWLDVVLSLYTPSDHHFSADEIFEIITAESDGPIADVCAVKGVTVPMYCVWKTRYRDLTLDELRNARRRALWRARGLIGGLAIVAVLGAGGIVFGIARAAYTAVTAAAEASSPAGLPPAPATSRQTLQVASFTPERRDVVLPGSAAAQAAPSSAPAAPPVQPRSQADAPSPVREPGYRIQVAAPETLQEGRAVVERLAAEGYPAYLTRAFVSESEVFRVRIGPFDTLSSAEEIAAQLHRDGYAGAWIARW
jgi:cell division septation protein DedD